MQKTEIVKGSITNFNDDGTVIIQASLPSIEKAILRKYKDVDIGFNDGRCISNIQRRKCFAIIGEIAEYIEGYRTPQTIDSTKQMLKMEFVLHRMQAMERKMFSLSDVSMSTASEFIDYLIAFCVKNDIPMSISPLEYCEDIAKYIIACLHSRKCAICGKTADIHHCDGDRIGMGNNRDEVHHLGRKVLPLCRIHHDEAHHDEKGFIDKYHLQPITLDKELCKRLKLKE